MALQVSLTDTKSISVSILNIISETTIGKSIRDLVTFVVTKISLFLLTAFDRLIESTQDNTFSGDKI